MSQLRPPPQTFSRSRTPEPANQGFARRRQSVGHRASVTSKAGRDVSVVIFNEKPRVKASKRPGGQDVETKDGKKFHLTDEEYEYYKEAFNLFDRDGSGAIDLEELGAVMLSIGLQPTQEELLNMIEKVDDDHTGTVEFDEFLQMSHEWMIQGRLETTDQIREAFDLMDMDGNGYISAADLARVLEGLNEDKSDEEMLDMIKEFDLDGDGQVGFDEFMALITEK
ncbi:hypothetical protein SpCBS45565_g06272 [Spizellomyces sp. 'palustris']|nr:hypothetical protein SpCBS45565_g06272 [Spizellomyces sp. 'palustris']